MRQRHSCISHGSNEEHNPLRSWHATMYKFVTSMVRCGLGMQQCAMHNTTIQKKTFFELGVYNKHHHPITCSKDLCERIENPSKV